MLLGANNNKVLNLIVTIKKNICKEKIKNFLTRLIVLSLKTRQNIVLKDKIKANIYSK